MAGSKEPELRKPCQICAAKKAIMLSSSSSVQELNILGCVDPKCLNFYDPTNGGRSKEYSAADGLSESQRFVLAHLQLNGTKETEKLKQLLSIPYGRMNEDQRCSTTEELGKFRQEICRQIEEISQALISEINNNGH